MSDWEGIGKAKAESVLNLIPDGWRISEIPSTDDKRDVTAEFIRQYLNSSEVEITETDAVGIVKNTTSGTWTALEVATAFCHRAAIAHQLVPCLHEIFFDDAISEAQKLDEYFTKHKKPVGPLHGLPVSLKDQLHVRGQDTHMGYIGWIGTYQGRKGTGKEKVFESELVRELRSLGATLYCKTSVPHTLMCGETINNITGYTQNPKNRLLSSGGSSGGEGALISLRGSVLGFGTDIGGSIRIPAAFNGLFGLRPSAGRFPYEGMANSMDGQNSILSVVGPLITTVDGLKLVTQAVLSTEPWLQDPAVVELPWRQEAEQTVQENSTKLAFGVLRHDGACHVTPPVTRAIETVAESLAKAGHTLIDWNPIPTHTKLMEIISKVFTFDGGAEFKRDFALSGEPPAPQLIMEEKPQADASAIMAVNIAKREAQKEYLDYWNSTAALTGTGRPVDAIIAPIAPWPAARPGQYTYYAYAGFVNVLDYTAVTIPVLLADKDIDVRVENFAPFDDTDQKTQELYDPEIYHGAHVGIQLVGRRLQEEKMIALANYVSEQLPSQV